MTDKELPLHWHDTDVVSYVLDGPQHSFQHPPRLTAGLTGVGWGAGETYFLEEDGTRHEARAGDRVVIPAGAKHAEGAVAVEVQYVVSHRGPDSLRDGPRPAPPSHQSPLAG